MSPRELTQLRNLQASLDLAYILYAKMTGSDPRAWPSSEGRLSVSYGTHPWRMHNNALTSSTPAIEEVCVYSSIFSAGRVLAFSSLDEAEQVIGTWYEEMRRKAGSDDVVRGPGA